MTDSTHEDRDDESRAAVARYRQARTACDAAMLDLADAGFRMSHALEFLLARHSKADVAFLLGVSAPQLDEPVTLAPAVQRVAGHRETQRLDALGLGGAVPSGSTGDQT